MTDQHTYSSTDTGVETSPGEVRTLNEDSFFVRPDRGIWAIADGMGGHEFGDWASQEIARELATLGRSLSLEDQHARVLHRIFRAHESIRRRSATDAKSHVGSTVVVLGVVGDRFSCVWSGDSRCYHIRGHEMIRVTRDHTRVQAQLDRGEITEEDARARSDRNVITRAVGITDDPRCETYSGQVRAGDCFVLCSDGLTEHLDDDAILRRLREGFSARMTAQGVCEQLVRDTHAAGARDNVTVVILRFLGATEMPVGAAEPVDGGVIRRPEIADSEETVPPSDMMHLPGAVEPSEAVGTGHGDPRLNSGAFDDEKTADLNDEAFKVVNTVAEPKADEDSLEQMTKFEPDPAEDD